jgi:hypothetical protein
VPASRNPPLPFFQPVDNNEVMQPDCPAQPEPNDSRDEAINAIVEEQNPPGDFFYPYAAGASQSAAGGKDPFLVRAIDGLMGKIAGWLRRAGRPPDFVVPKRFGMSAILGITTALALLFGGLKWGNAWPVFYLFFGMQAIVICLVQMFAGGAPRMASTATGAVMLPVFALIAAGVADRGPPIEGLACALPLLVPFGALLGYVTGTCAAGVFLVMDYLEPYLQGRSSLHRREQTGASSS